MAEALAALGAVASAVQLCHISKRVLQRLDDSHSKSSDAPRSFSQLRTQLKVLQEISERTQAALAEGSVPSASSSGLHAALDDCRGYIESLDAVMVKSLPTPDDSWSKRSFKAISSPYFDAKIRDSRDDLWRSVQTLTYYHVANGVIPRIRGSWTFIYDARLGLYSGFV